LQKKAKEAKYWIHCRRRQRKQNTGFILEVGKGSKILNSLQKKAKEANYWIQSKSRQRKQNTAFIAEEGEGIKILNSF
jgi:hypothetical protein